MGGFLINLLTGGLADKFFGWLGDRDRQRYAAMNDAQKFAHDERQAARAAALSIRLATAGHWEMRLITFVIAACFVTHLVLVTIDTNWPQPWNVASFPKPFDEWEGAIILSFFGVQVVNKVATSAAAASVLKARAQSTGRTLIERLTGRREGE